MQQKTIDKPESSKQYTIQAIEGEETRVRKPRHWLRFTLRRVDDGRIIQAKLRLTRNVGDTVWLDDQTLQVGLWKP
jgi:hypothetical protein